MKFSLETKSSTLSDIGDYPSELLPDFQFKCIELKSSVFSKWDSIRENNIRKSFDHFMHKEAFTEFVVHALHLSSKKPRSHNSVVHVEAHQGFGLGQITAYTSYAVHSLGYTLWNLGRQLQPKTFEEVVRNRWLELSGRPAPPLLDEQVKKEILELEGDIFVTIVLFISNTGASFVMQTNVPKSYKKKLHPYKCDQIAAKAAKAFEKLKQQMSMLEVVTPDLNELDRFDS
jgi:hypothetical protein